MATSMPSSANRLNQPNRVWLNQGGTQGGTARHVHRQRTNAWHGNSYGISLGDVDGDGDLDAFVANVGANRVWLNQGNGTFIDSGQSLGSNLSYGVSLGDVDGDGDLDAFVANSGVFSKPNKIWLNQGGTREVQPDSLATADSRWEINPAAAYCWATWTATETSTPS